ncbi:MAG: hypothetical protein WC809_18870 [Sinimarinibacterium sp.]|jgi:hypothetical protein
MRIRITRQTVAQKRNVRPGDVVDVPEGEARLLIGGAKAEFFREAAADPAAPASARPRAGRKAQS